MPKTIFFLTIALAFLAGSVASQERHSIFDELLQEGLAVDVEIEAAMMELVENRRLDEPVPARFTFEDSEGHEQSFSIKLEQRGKYRRRICDFPPLSLNFSKSELQQLGFYPKYDKLKLVTHCLDDKEEGQELLLKEYLAYELYRELTGQSYRVQLARVTYIDVNGEMNKARRYGFIIEDTDEMAHRLGGTECEDCVNPPDSLLEASSENLMSVFQYMIGNTDWSIQMARNIKAVSQKNGGKLIPVPYDFDFSGFVDAPYALPSADYGQLSVKQRVFLGKPASRATLEETLRLVYAKKERLLERVWAFKPLSADARRACQDYLETFFLEAEQILMKTGPYLDSPLLQQPGQLRPQGVIPAGESPAGK
ncbi:MAG: hypothetical protein KDC66_20375 [Phaeodactylibacter sp.]|nr:hypothetical protein [Phaeodactylibacter sp.]MCB9274102.1 hypothetical protein [Lewinellaceae bacterium]